MAEEQTTSVASVTKMYNQYNLLQVRLDTSKLIEDLKLYLNAELEIVTQDSVTGEFKRKTIKVGEPMANKNGRGKILNWVAMTINPHTFQGNFLVDNKKSSTAYERYIYEFQTNLATYLMGNITDFGIKESEYSGIIDSIMGLVIPVMSRLIGNKERESYGETFREVSSSNISDRRKISVN